MARAMVTSWPCSAFATSAKIVLPMPMTTASTMTLTPAAITLPSTRSARNVVRFQSANGTSTKPASAISLNSTRVTNICTASTKNAATTPSQASSRNRDLDRVHHDLGKPDQGLDVEQDRMGGGDTGIGDETRPQQIVGTGWGRQTR